MRHCLLYSLVGMCEHSHVMFPARWMPIPQASPVILAVSVHVCLKVKQAGKSGALTAGQRPHTFTAPCSPCPYGGSAAQDVDVLSSAAPCYLSVEIWQPGSGMPSFPLNLAALKSRLGCPTGTCTYFRHPLRSSYEGMAVQMGNALTSATPHPCCVDTQLAKKTSAQL